MTLPSFAGPWREGRAGWRAAAASAGGASSIVFMCGHRRESGRPPDDGIQDRESQGGSSKPHAVLQTPELPSQKQCSHPVRYFVEFRVRNRKRHVVSFVISSRAGLAEGSAGGVRM